MLSPPPLPDIFLIISQHFLIGVRVGTSHEQIRSSPMLHQFLGVEPPKKKEKVDTKQANKDYDATKRQRKIVGIWRTESADWIVIDDREQTIYCRICRSVYGPLSSRRQADKYRRYANGAFVVGCKNFRHDALTGHGASEGHKLAREINNTRNAAPGERPAEKAIEQLNNKTFDCLKNLFINAHALCMSCRPVTGFVWMCQADEKKNVDIGNTYRNATSCKQFLVAICEI